LLTSRLVKLVEVRIRCCNTHTNIYIYILKKKQWITYAGIDGLEIFISFHWWCCRQEQTCAGPQVTTATQIVFYVKLPNDPNGTCAEVKLLKQISDCGGGCVFIFIIKDQNGYCTLRPFQSLMINVHSAKSSSFGRLQPCTSKLMNLIARAMALLLASSPYFILYWCKTFACSFSNLAPSC
jgi:hypothetical protein